MRPRGGALHHPAAEDLLEYATKGCPVDCGRDWTREEIEAAILNGNSKTVENDREAAECIRRETFQKIKEGHVRLVPWDSIKDNLPKNLKNFTSGSDPTQIAKVLNSFKLSVQTPNATTETGIG